MSFYLNVAHLAVSTGATLYFVRPPNDSLENILTPLTVGLSTFSSIQALRSMAAWGERKIRNIRGAIERLHANGIQCSGTNFRFLTNHGEFHLLAIAGTIDSLRAAGIAPMQADFESLVAHEESAEAIGSIIRLMHQEGFAPTRADYEFLIAQGEFADQLGLGILYMLRAGIPLSQELREFLATQGRYAGCVGHAIGELHRTGLLTANNRDLLAANGQHADKIGSALLFLSDLPPTQADFEFLVANGQAMRDIIRLLLQLDNAEILTRANFDGVATNGGGRLQALFEALPNTPNLNQELFNEIIREIEIEECETVATVLGEWNGEIFDRLSDSRTPPDVLERLCDLSIPSEVIGNIAELGTSYSLLHEYWHNASALSHRVKHEIINTHFEDFRERIPLE